MKTKHIIYSFALLATMFFGSFANAQEGNELSASQMTSDWSLLSEKDGVQFFVRLETCPTSKVQRESTYSFIKINNTTSADVTVEWQLGVLYDYECVGCEEIHESLFAVTVPANSSVAGDCSFSVNGELNRFIKMSNNPADTRVFEGVRLITFNVR